MVVPQPRIWSFAPTWKQPASSIRRRQVRPGDSATQWPQRRPLASGSHQNLNQEANGGLSSGHVTSPPFSTLSDLHPHPSAPPTTTSSQQSWISCPSVQFSSSPRKPSDVQSHAGTHTLTVNEAVCDSFSSVHHRLFVCNNQSCSAPLSSTLSLLHLLPGPSASFFLFFCPKGHFTLCRLLIG